MEGRSVTAAKIRIVLFTHKPRNKMKSLSGDFYVIILSWESGLGFCPQKYFSLARGRCCLLGGLFGLRDSERVLSGRIRTIPNREHEETVFPWSAFDFSAIL